MPTTFHFTSIRSCPSNGLGESIRRNLFGLMVSCSLLPGSLGLAQSDTTATNSASRGAGNRGSAAGGSAPLAHYGEGYVLLQHGAVMHGFIKPQADSVTIVMDKGKEVTVSKRQILTIGASKEALYRYQTKAIRKWGTGEHWHLAQWCIQNGMLDQAIEHYLELEKQASDNPRFKQLDLQLKQALLEDESVRRAMVQQGIELPGGVGAVNNGAENSTVKDSGVGVEVLGAVPGVQGKSIKQPEGLDVEEPVRLVSSFPAHTIPGYVRKSFQTEITPVVVARCGQSGCHGMLAKNPFQIFQPVGEQAASINDRNLERVLRYIDSENPTESDLLKYAAQAHGTQRNASLNMNRDEDRIHLERIAQWIQSLSRLPSGDSSVAGTNRVISAGAMQVGGVEQGVRTAHAVASKSAGGSVGNTSGLGGSRPLKETSEVVADRNAKLSKPPKTGGAGVVIDALELAGIEEEIAKLERKPAAEGPGAKSAAKDPFDAKIFNSKHGTVKP